MLYALDHSKNNFVMRCKYKSAENDFHCTGPSSYVEATKFYREGYTEIL